VLPGTLSASARECHQRDERGSYDDPPDQIPQSVLFRAAALCTRPFLARIESHRYVDFFYDGSKLCRGV